MDKTGSSSCPVCLSSDVKGFFDIKNVPVHCNLIWNSKDAALSAPQGDLALTYCNKCGHVFNSKFEPEKMEYRGQYENSLHFSPTFQRYAEKLAESLIERYNIRDCDIIEIGCGDGQFLNLLCEKGSNRGVGFDPSAKSLSRGPENPDVTIIPDYYTEKYKDYAADFVCCRQVLEHLSNPREFLANLSRILKNRGITYFFEVPNASYTFTEMGIWDLIYEHPNYYTKNSLEHLFKTAGYEIANIMETYGGQFLTIEATKGCGEPPINKADISNPRFKESIEKFPIKFNEKIEYWNKKLKSLSESGEKAVIWGAGSKGVSFLNLVENNIRYVVDINPNKQGGFVPKEGQKVVPPEYLLSYVPEQVILMNLIYEKEIKKTLLKTDIPCQVICA